MSAENTATLTEAITSSPQASSKSSKKIAAPRPLNELRALNEQDEDVTEEITLHLEAAVDEYGQMGAQCADLYFLYGDNMLRMAQKLGKKKTIEDMRRRRDARVNGDVSKDAEAPGIDLQEVNELFEISWENLEVARHIYQQEFLKEKDETKKNALLQKLGNILIRLGDHQCERVLVDEGIATYHEALKIRTEMKAEVRTIAETKLCIGNAYRYKEQYGTAKKYFLQARSELDGLQGMDDLIADLDKKIKECDVGNLQIAPEDDAGAKSSPAEPAKRRAEAAFPASQSTEEKKAKIASASVIQVRKKVKMK